MNFFTHNIIKKGILGILVLFVLLVPVSVSVTSSETIGNTTIVPQLTMSANVAMALSLMDLGQGTFDLFFNLIGQAILNIGSITTLIGGRLLDISITNFVLGMGDQINGQGLGTAI